jgi:hypothetical protein
VEEVLRKGSHTMDSVIRSVRKGVSTRRQLANFNIHQYPSCLRLLCGTPKGV